MKKLFLVLDIIIILVYIGLTILGISKGLYPVAYVTIFSLLVHIFQIIIRRKNI